MSDTTHQQFDCGCICRTWDGKIVVKGAGCTRHRLVGVHEHLSARGRKWLLAAAVPAPSSTRETKP